MKTFNEFNLQQFAIDQRITKAGAGCVSGKEVIYIDRLAGLFCIATVMF